MTMLRNPQTDKLYKNDLSGSTAKLDYDALVRVALVCVGELKNQIERRTRNIQEATLQMALEQDTGIHASREAQSMAEEAANLAIAFDVLHILQEAKTRYTLEIVNAPLAVDETDNDICICEHRRIDHSALGFLASCFCGCRKFTPAE